MKIEQMLPKEYHERAAVQLDNVDKLMGLGNVNGVALGNRIKAGQETGEGVIQVYVSQKLPAELLTEKDTVPKKIKGVATDVLDVGEVFAGGGPAAAVGDPRLMPTDSPGIQTLRRRIRPVKGGYSVGHFQITAGTIATCCYDAEPFPGIPPHYYILSNNHVLANSNAAQLGDPILQPGPIDGGTMPNDVVARLSRFVPIRFIQGSDAPCNFVDAAIAKGDFEDLDREIYWVGHVKRMYLAPKVDDIVQKCGRTTNFTTGKVLGVNATVDVNFGGGRVARFCRQIVTTPMSAGGDSGSLVTNVDEDGVGLLFAGSSAITIMNHLSFVQSLLRIRITEQ